MTLSRRSLLTVPLVLAAAPALAQGSGAGGTTPTNADARLSDRGYGPAGAKVVVQEYFSLTCPHCAAFHKDAWPQIKDKLMGEGGNVRMVWKEFPLDQLALAASQVARSAPAERYEGFISALLASQDRWAFARGADNIAEIAKIAALAGMTRAQVDAAVADQALAKGILEMRAAGQSQFSVNSTPTFVFNKKVQPGAVSVDRFAQLATEAGA